MCRYSAPERNTQSGVLTRSTQLRMTRPTLPCPAGSGSQTHARAPPSTTFVAETTDCTTSVTCNRGDVKRVHSCCYCRLIKLVVNKMCRRTLPTLRGLPAAPLPTSPAQFCVVLCAELIYLMVGRNEL